MQGISEFSIRADIRQSFDIASLISQRINTHASMNHYFTTVTELNIARDNKFLWKHSVFVNSRNTYDNKCRMILAVVEYLKTQGAYRFLAYFCNEAFKDITIFDKGQLENLINSAIFLKTLKI